MNKIAALEELLSKIEKIAGACENVNSNTEFFALYKEYLLVLDECIRVGRCGADDVAVQGKISRARGRLITIGNNIAQKLNLIRF